MRALTLLLGLLLIQTQALAETPCPQPLRVGISQIGYSYYVREDGTPAGSSFDFYNELTRRSGCVFELIPQPRVRTWHEAEQRHLDIVSPTFRTPERDRHGQFVEYFRNRNDLILLRDLAQKITTFEQLLDDPTIVIGLVRGHSNGAYFDARLQALMGTPRVQLSPNAHNVFLKLRAGRIQATLMTAGLYQKELDELELSDDVRIIQVPQADALAVGLYLSRLTLTPPTSDWLSQHVRAMVEDGTLRALLSRRHGKRLTERFYTPTKSP
jgi:polar amino acid transport system substrate-binding protein